ncbi:uncharacterized protein LOC110266220 [Arachis ipaensis]|uniref:uncharacterized protein LOC110266220 n=1 Tax=Arachis ipaensis TaxID=130454 RepID=UPI000A2AFD20|nr:uncharacterized protein LOC110266220 [Arachis ipaensis]
MDKPLVSNYMINGVKHLVEYEEIHQVCFQCGRIGHEKAGYPERTKLNSANEENRTKKGGETQGSTEVEDRGRAGNLVESKGKKVINTTEENFGPWMLVQRQTRGRRTNKGAETGDSGAITKEKGKEVVEVGGQSRFAILSNEDNMEAQNGNEEIDVRKEGSKDNDKEKARERHYQTSPKSQNQSPAKTTLNSKIPSCPSTLNL